MPVVQTDDQQLITRLKAKDETALGALMAEYGPKVYGLSVRLTGNHHDAEEVLQDVFWTVFAKIGSFRGASKLSSWIYRITVNTALMRLRKRTKAMELPLEAELGPAMTEEGMIAEPVRDWSPRPDDELSRKELADRLTEAIRHLPPEYRAVVVLRDVEGFSAEETSRVLGISIAAIKSRLHRARLFLRKHVAEYAASQRP